MVKLPLYVWCVRDARTDPDLLSPVLAPHVERWHSGSAQALRAHLAADDELPDVALIERWDPQLAANLDELPRVWLDAAAAVHDEIAFAGELADGTALLATVVTAVNLGRARLIRDAVQAARRTEFAPSREPLPDLGDFMLHFQGRWSIDGARLTGAETLLRWNGMPVPTLSPESLVADAERRGDIRRLGDWIVMRACRHAAEWRHLWPDEMRLSINVSPRQLAADGFTESLARALETNRLDPDSVELEIPVNSLERLADVHGGVIADLYDLGVGFVVDGIGADVLDPALLTWLPATTWKFHRALVARLPHDRAGAELIGALAEAARAQRILTVAVGVEREDQRAALDALGCDALQGYLFAEPLPPDEFGALLAAHRERSRARE